MRTTILASGFAALIGAFANVASASLVQALSLRALTSEAQQVFVGRVIGESSLYDENERIVTDVRLQVEESVKGSLTAGQSITVRKHGGVVGDIATRVLGEPSFQVGEEVVLFAARQNTARPFRTVGMAQGALRVFEQEGRPFVRSASGDAAAVTRAPDGTLVRAALALPSARPLAQVLEEIRGIAGE